MSTRITRTALSILTAIVVAAAPAAAQTAKTTTEAQAEAKAAAKAAARAQAERQRMVERQKILERQREAREQREQRRRAEQPFEQKETITKTVRLGSEGAIDLHNMSGSVTVTRGGGSDATIEAVKVARGATDAAAREMLQLVKIDIAERAGRVDVRTEYPFFERGRTAKPEHRNVNVAVHYTISAPAGTRLRVNSMSGNITVSDITGELSLEAMSGNIKIDRAGRITTAKTMSGDVAIASAKSEGVIDTGSMSGNVTLKQVKARRVAVGVVSGTISLVDVDCERVDAQTTSGTIVFEGALAKNGRYRFGTHSGDVKVAVAGDTGFELDASSWGGGVQSDLKLKDEQREAASFRRGRPGPPPPPPGAPPPPGVPGTGHARSLRGVYGDGSAVIDINTFNGTVLITKR